MYYDLGVVRVADDRMECDADRPDVRRRGLTRDLGTTSRRRRAVPPRVAAPPGRRALLAPGLGRGHRGADHLSGVPHRWLARRLSQPAAPLVRATGRSRRSCSSARGITAIRTPAIPGPRIDHLREVVRWLDHWCRGIDDGRHGRAADRGLHAGGRLPGAGPDWRAPGRWRAERSWPPAGATERDVRTWALTAGWSRTTATDPARSGRRPPRRRPDRRHDRRAVVGRRPVRAARRPAARRGPVR